MELAGFEIVILILLHYRRDQHSGWWWLKSCTSTLMIMGMPPEVANATNRVGIFVESVVAVCGFKRHKVRTFDLGAILFTMAIGGLFGLLAVASTSAILKRF